MHVCVTVKCKLCSSFRMKFTISIVCISIQKVVKLETSFFPKVDVLTTFYSQFPNRMMKFLGMKKWHPHCHIRIFGNNIRMDDTSKKLIFFSPEKGCRETDALLQLFSNSVIKTNGRASRMCRTLTLQVSNSIFAAHQCALC